MNKETNKNQNPLLQESALPFGVIDFPSIKLHHYTQAIKIGIKESKRLIKQICANKECPTFKNTIAPLEYEGKTLSRAQSAYSTLYSAHSDDAFRAISPKIFSMLAKQENSIYSNKKLFKRISHIYKNGDSLGNQEKRLVELYYKQYIRRGVNLPFFKQQKLKRINLALNLLSPKFSKNAIKAVNSYTLFVSKQDESKLEGIPAHLLELASNLAKSKNLSGYIFTLQPPSYIPFLTYCKDRNLREEIYRAYNSKNCYGKYSNCKIIKKIVALREKRATILGYQSHAHYVLENRMAKEPKAVFEFLEQLQKAYHPAAKRDLEIVQKEAFQKDSINTEDFMPWDFSYYANLVKQKKFDFDPEELRPYFKAQNVIEGLFKIAKKLYGLEFIENSHIPKYHPDMITYEVVRTTSGEAPNTIGILYFDLYPRDTKQSGAWMNDMRCQCIESGINRVPHILICANLTPPSSGRPSLLSYDEANTLFHEFGHALHGLLSNVKYTSIASPNVLWDFVELPSQFMENYLTKKECLMLFAKEYQSGNPIPSDLIKKLENSLYYNEGYIGLRQVMLANLDMRWHTTKSKTIKDVLQFEESVSNSFLLLPKIEGTAISPSFSHIFAGGYSSGYYSYKWAEKLDADAFSYFEENGIFNPKLSKKFEHLLSMGNAIEPMELYKSFRGSEPTIDGLLKRVKNRE